MSERVQHDVLPKHSEVCRFCGSGELFLLPGVECGAPTRFAFADLDSVCTYFCCHCGVAGSYPLPEKVAVEEFYNSTYRSSSGLQRGYPLLDFEAMERQRFRFEYMYELLESEGLGEEFRKILTHGKKLNVLDIGCYTGEALRAMSEVYGAEVYGFELDDWAIKYGSLINGIEISKLSADDVEFTSFKMGTNFVMMLHVLEHVRDPRGLLDKINQVLTRNGGYLYVEVPNYEKDISYEFPHLTHFTASSLSGLCANCGFEVIAIRERGTDLIVLLGIASSRRPVKKIDSQVSRRKFFLKRRVMTLFYRFLKIARLFQSNLEILKIVARYFSRHFF